LLLKGALERRVLTVRTVANKLDFIKFHVLRIVSNFLDSYESVYHRVCFTQSVNLDSSIYKCFYIFILKDAD